MFPQRRQLHSRQGGYARAFFTLVAPLANASATDMRTTDTTAQLDLFGGGSGAVAPLIGSAFSVMGGGLRQGDVDCANDGRTRRTPTTPGIRTSATATRTTTTSRTRTGLEPSAAWSDAGFSYGDLLAAYLDCRRAKRTTAAALAFEADQEENLVALHDELAGHIYRPGRSICFVITHPKPREVWAAAFRDRVVHHLLYNRVAPRFERAFIADSCACIEGRGTLYAARRGESMVRSVTRNWSRPAHYLKLDLANFFVSIDKQVLDRQLAARIPEAWWRGLARTILFHDPRADVDVRGNRVRLALIPAHKSLFNQPAHLGLPIGNLSSQFFANVYLDALDQFIKHELGARHYVRYVDDFLLLHRDPRQLNAWRDAIAEFLPRVLHVRLNDAKTILQPVERGIDFVGHMIKPWRRTARRRTFNAALHRLAAMPAEDLAESATSTLGLLRQATHSHRDRARLANIVRRRGFAVDHQLTKVYP